MTDEECCKALEEMRPLVAVWNSRRLLRALDQAIAKLSPHNPPEGCMRVKVAIAVANYNKSDPSQGLIVGARGVDEIDDEKSAMDTAMGAVADDHGALLAYCFAEIDVPRIPTVRGVVVEDEK